MDHGNASALGARILTVADTFALGRFVPAAVQRDYQWEEAECQDLFSDLERVFAASETTRAADESDDARADDIDTDALVPDAIAPPSTFQRDYFLGAMVVRPTAPSLFEVFDGLQRLTSLTVMLCVLRDLAGDGEIADRLHALIVDDAGAFRVTLPGKDPTLRDEVQRRGEAGRARRAQTQSDMGERVRNACTLFRRELGRWDAQRRAAFVEFLLARVQIVSIAASDALLASQIFVTTNARGRPLNKVELFKGQLIDIAEDEATAERIAQAWATAQTLVGDELEDLLSTLDFIERREPQGADRLTKLADYLLRRYGGREIASWVDRLELSAQAWRDLKTRLYEPADADAGASVWMLRLFKWREWKPLALIWTAQYIRRPNDERARALFARRFDALHRRCLAITLLGYSDLDRTKTFARALGQVARQRDPLDQQGALGFDPAAHARMQETLRLPLIHDDTRLTLMRWIEAMHWRDRPPPRSIPRASVEHVLPLRPHASSTWLRDFPNEDTRFNTSHTLGNLALMDHRANEGMGNGDFAAKLPVFKTHADKFRLISEVAEQHEWSADLITARTKRLCEFVWAELALPPPRERR